MLPYSNMGDYELKTINPKVDCRNKFLLNFKWSVSYINFNIPYKTLKWRLAKIFKSINEKIIMFPT